MMKIIIVLAGLTSTILFWGCKKVEVPEGTPGCIKREIREFDKYSVPGARVVQYEFQGERVYAFESGTNNPDEVTNILDENCELFCRLGGNQGNVGCNGYAFYVYATNEKEIWRK